MLNWQDRLNPQAGGAEIHLHEIFGRLASRGHSTTLLTSGWPAAPTRLRLDGMDVHRTGGRYTFSTAAIAYYKRYLGDAGFDLVIEDLNKVPLFTPTWAPRRRIVLLVHHLFGRTAFQEAALPLAAATWLLEKPLGTMYRRVPVEAVSDSTADDLVRRGFDRERITVIPNGVDLAYYTPDEAERASEPTLLYLGRLKRYKRVDLIVRAVAQLKQDGIRVRLIVAGTGDHAAELARLRDELGLEAEMEMPGFVSEDEKRRLFRSAWVHLLTSPKEGWGITNLESAACGTPTIASDSPGLRDSVVDGETGFLVPHGDVAAIAARLRELVLDAALRERLGRQAREFAQRFSWESAADRTESHLDRVVAGAA